MVHISQCLHGSVVNAWPVKWIEIRVLKRLLSLRIALGVAETTREFRPRPVAANVH